jgi:hypothetical protein
LFFTFTPGVNAFFQMEAMTGTQWLRVVVSMVALYLLVEVEKALVDPVLMPIIRPVLAFIERHTPDWLAVDRKSINWMKRCRKPQVGPKRAVEDQRRASVKKLMVHRESSSGVMGGQGGKVGEGSVGGPLERVVERHGSIAGAGEVQIPVVGQPGGSAV